MPRDKTSTAPLEPMAAFAAGMDRALSALTTGEAVSAKTMQAISASVTAALEGADKARAHVAASSARVLEEQIAAASAFAQVKSPQEAFQLQTQFTRQALEAYTADMATFGGLMSAYFQQSLKPLTDRLHSPA